MLNFNLKMLFVLKSMLAEIFPPENNSNLDFDRGDYEF